MKTFFAKSAIWQRERAALLSTVPAVTNDFPAPNPQDPWRITAQLLVVCRFVVVHTAAANPERRLHAREHRQ
jgi:hypothetical protein